MSQSPSELPKLRLPSGLLNLKGQVFGHLRVLYITGRRHKKKRMWMCQCDCGSDPIVVRHDYLLHTNNPKTHCGCQNRGLPTQFPQEYHIWDSMIRRCYYEKHVGYPQYGGRGIVVCDAWRNKDTGFAQFLADMGRRPSKNHSLDRQNPSGHYEPGNVRWATNKEQARNKRGSIFIKHPQTGNLVPAAEVAEFLGITYQSMRARYMRQGLWPQPQKGEGK